MYHIIQKLSYETSVVFYLPVSSHDNDAQKLNSFENPYQTNSLKN